MSDTDTDTAGPIDAEIERNGMLARFGEFIAAGRPVRPMAVFFKGRTRLIAVHGRSWEDEEDFNQTLHEMFFLFVSLQASTALIGMPGQVHLASNDMTDAIVTIVLTPNGQNSEAHTYGVVDGEVNWDVPELKEDGQVYSKQIEHMLPIFATTRSFPFTPTEVVDFLTHNDYDIEYFGEKRFSNLDC